MADTNHHAHGSAIPVEGDGVSYSGIVWFVVILTVTTLFCQALVVGHVQAACEHRVRRARDRGARRALRRRRAGDDAAGSRTCLIDEPANLQDVPRRTRTTTLDDLRLGRQERRHRAPADRSRPRTWCSSEGFPVRPAAAAGSGAAPARTARSQREAHGKSPADTERRMTHADDLVQHGPWRCRHAPRGVLAASALRRSRRAAVGAAAGPAATAQIPMLQGRRHRSEARTRRCRSTRRSSTRTAAT